MNSFTNHLQSNRHKELETKLTLNEEQRAEIQLGIIKDPKPKEKPAPVEKAEVMDGIDDTDSNWADIADEDDVLKDYGL